MTNKKTYTLLLLSIALSVLACSLPSLATRAGPTPIPTQVPVSTATQITASNPTQTLAPTAINLKMATSVQIAETVTRLYYTIDYQNLSGWLEATQPYSTEYGVKIMRDGVAPAIWPEFTRLKTKVDASQIKVKCNKKITGGHSTENGTDWEIHIVDVTLDPAINWPGKTGYSYVNVMVEKTVDGWRFVSFLSNEMTKSISDVQQVAKSPTPTK